MTDTTALQISNLMTIDTLDDLIKSYEKGQDGGGVVLWFHNGYGLSVSWRLGTYGGLEGAVLHEEEGDLVYDTSVTCDVVGWLNRETLLDLIIDVAALPVRVHTEATRAYAKYGKYGYDEEADWELQTQCSTFVIGSPLGLKTWTFSDGSTLVLNEEMEFENPRLRMK
jgi:hypothetical protein